MTSLRERDVTEVDPNGLVRNVSSDKNQVMP